MPKAEEGMQVAEGQPQSSGGDPMQQVMQMAQQMAQEGADPMQIAQALIQQGLPPEAVAQVLVQLGMPEEQVQQVLQQVMQGGQEGQPQGQPMMENGGESGVDSIMKYMADGGQTEQPQGGGDQMQQIMQMAQQMAQEGADPMQIVQALMEQGVPPEAVAQVLVQLGMPEEQDQQVMQQIMQGGQQGPPQEGAPQGQPMMEEGGETGQQEQIQQLIMMFAEMQGQDPKEIMQMLQEAKPEEQEQMLQQMVQAVQEAQQDVGQGQMAPPSPSEQIQMMLGGTKKDFNKIRKERIKEFKAGGVTDANSLDTTSVKGHAIGLSDALKKVMYTGMVVNNMNSKYDNMATAFDDIPMAINGYENKRTPTAEELKTAGYDSAEKFGEASREEREAVYNTMPNKVVTNLNLGAVGAGSALTADERAQASAMGINDPGFSPDGTRERILQNQRNSWIDQQRGGGYQGNDPGWGRSGGNRGRNNGRGFLNPNGYQGGVQRDGFGNITGQDHYYPGWNAQGNPNQGRNNNRMSPWADLFGSFGGGNRGGNNGGFNFQGFGEHKGLSFDQFIGSLGKDTDVSLEPIWKQNIFGKEKRHTKRNIAAYRFDTRRGTPTDGDGATENNTMEGILASQNATMDDYNNNPEMKREVDALMAERGVSPTIKADYSESDEMKAQRDLDEANERKQAQRDLDAAGISQKQAKDWELDVPLTDTQDRSSATQPAETTSPGYADSLNNEEAYDKQAIKQMNLPEGTDFNTLSPEQQDIYFSIFDPLYEAGQQMNYGGETKEYFNGGQHVGTPFRWDGKTKKFIPYAKDGMNFDANQFADGAMGVGYQLTGFLDDMNAFQNDQKAIKNRAMDAITPVQPNNSGVEGYEFTNLHGKMSQDTGTDVMPGTGTDWEGFNKGQRVFNSSLTSGFYANGGLTKGARGMEKNSELTLNDDQIKFLQKAGYGIKLKS